MSAALAPADPRRRPKGDKRARTRAALLDAARELIRERGYERTTLQAVAERAGMTSGAIYGNFRNRDALFVALGEAFWAPVKPKIRPDSTFAEKMHALAEAYIAVIPERRPAVFGRLTGMAHATANEALRAEVRAVTERNFATGAAWLRSVADEGGLPMPAETLVLLIHAVTEGLLLQRFLTPDLVPDEAFHAAFAALASKPSLKRPPAGAAELSGGPKVPLGTAFYSSPHPGC